MADIALPLPDVAADILEMGVNGLETRQNYVCTGKTISLQNAQHLLQRLRSGSLLAHISNDQIQRDLLKVKYFLKEARSREASSVSQRMSQRTKAQITKRKRMCTGKPTSSVARYQCVCMYGFNSDVCSQRQRMQGQRGGKSA